ncbi:MAG: SPFH domain-containing protein [Oscillospiraceae bacterium]|nr:SPFH domain-containing protein [Oscillospiraceae bacterium]MBR6608619.1 SPFH domain-containing protein [Oscillospiraceae bacterium]
MGLIKAALGSASGVMADQWKEYFYCDSIPADVLMLKGQKRNSGRSSNTRGSDNIITDGSIINVADGQCMMIVESGKIVDLCDVPGEYTYSTGTEPTIFTEGKLAANLGTMFEEMGKRFAFGGEAAKDQRIYFFNTKHILGNKFGTASPVPFRVVDQRAGIDIDIGVKCFGEYVFRLVNPMLFYKNIAGNAGDQVTRQQLESKMRTDFLQELQPAFAKLSEMGIRYSAIPGHTRELADIMKGFLSAEWGVNMGLELVDVNLASIKANEEDEAMIKDMQRAAAYTNPDLAMASRVAAENQAMKDAANNAGGAAVGFMGMNMVGNMGGNTMQTMYRMQQNKQVNEPAKPAANTWKCSCGAENTGKFCAECGSPKPVADVWKCTNCGTENKGKFCAECGSPKPAATAVKCANCGWEPEAGAPVGKFCPECGTPFNK